MHQSGRNRLISIIDTLIRRALRESTQYRLKQQVIAAIIIFLGYLLCIRVISILLLLLYN